MVPLKKGLRRCVKIPTLEDWAKAKEQLHLQKTKLPFIQKLRILDNLKRDAIDWEKSLPPGT